MDDNSDEEEQDMDMVDFRPKTNFLQEFYNYFCTSKIEDYSNAEDVSKNDFNTTFKSRKALNEVINAHTVISIKFIARCQKQLKI